MTALSRACRTGCTIAPMKDGRLPLLCAGLMAAGFVLASHFTWAWWLAWLAPVPLLWFAFSQANPVTVMAAALGAGALMALGWAWPYAGVLPAPELQAAVALSAIGFALCVMGARLAGRAVSPMAAVAVFAGLWTLWDFVAASGPDGALASPAFSQASSPVLIQSAALFGGWVVTFLIAAVSGFLALAFQRRNVLYLLPAAALFTANLAFGAFHMDREHGPDRRVTLIASDKLAEAGSVDQRDIALGAVLAYAAEIRLKAQGSDLVVLPERIAVLRPAWRQAAIGILRAGAAGTGATVVAGFAWRDSGAAHNIALAIAPDGGVSQYVQGRAGGIPVAISHDLNFFALLRHRAAKHRFGLIAVPGWDFGRDEMMQMHKAILRAVENGFALARTARDGMLVLADAHGRVAGEKSSASADGFSVLTGVVAIGAAPGQTLYDRIGDGFVWGAGGLALSLLLYGLLRVVLSLTPAEDMRRRISMPAPHWIGINRATRHAAPPQR